MRNKRNYTILFCLLIIFPHISFADFSQPSFTGYFNVSSKDNYSNGYDPPLAGAFFQKLTLPDQPIEDIYGVTVKMSAQDLGLDPDCRLIPHVSLILSSGDSMTFTPAGYHSGAPYTTDGEYFIGGSNFALEPKNLVGHDVDVLFTVRELYFGPKVTNLNQIAGIRFGGLLTDNLHDPSNCTITADWSHNWSNAVLMVGHGEDVLPNNDLKYLTINNETTTTPEDLTLNIKTTKFYTGKTPILIVPGVLGTNIKNDALQLWLNLGKMFTDVGDDFMSDLAFDQDLKTIHDNLKIEDIVKVERVSTGVGKVTIFDYSDNLIREFVENGYIEGTTSTSTLFTFPYDWRYGVSGKYEDGTTNVDLLKKKIQEIMELTGANKVDVVAHSTGGLLVKKYVVDNFTEPHIGKAVFVGVPNTGAPKAIKVFLQGDGFGVPWLADGEMQKLSTNFPVVYDLAPSQKYYDFKGSFITIRYEKDFAKDPVKDLNFADTKDFLLNDHNLNSSAYNGAADLHTVNFDDFDLRTAGIDLYNIAGCKSGTIGKIKEVRDSYYGTTLPTYDDPQEVPGDGTVPLESSTNLPVNPSHKFYALDSDHGKMMSQDGIRQLIVNIIARTSLDMQGKITQDIGKCKLKGKGIAIYSPVSIKVTDQDGNLIQVESDGSLTKEIPNADFNLMGEHKFLYLPYDEGQSYNIDLQGTGDGVFTLKIQDIDDTVQKMYVYANLEVTASLKGKLEFTGGVPQLSLDSDGDGTWDKVLSPDSTLDHFQAQDITPPISTSTITGNLKTSVSVSLSATDPVLAGHENETSGVLRTYYSLNKSSYLTYASPISFTEPGNYALLFYSIDKAGNKEEPQTVNISVSAEKIDSSSSGSGGGGGGGCVDCQPPRDVSLSFLKNENGKSYFTLAAQDESLPLMMQVSESQDFPKAVWQKFNSNIEWTFSTTTANTLYARVRDSRSNIGEAVSATAALQSNVRMGEVLGESTSILQAHPTGSLIIDGTGTVYIIENNIKRPFVSAERFLQLSYQFNQVQFPWTGDASLLLGMPI